jgi:hypothetical protein
VFVSDGEDGKRSSPPGWYPYGERHWAWWDGEAFVSYAPRAPALPQQPYFEPPKPGIGKKATAAWVVLGLVLTTGLVTSAVKLGHDQRDKLAATATVRQAEVVDSSDGCARMYDFLKGVQQSDGITAEEIAARVRGLRDAARANDPQLAIDLQGILDAADEGRVHELTWLIMTRCLSVGDLTSAQLAEVGVTGATIS